MSEKKEKILIKGHLGGKMTLKDHKAFKYISSRQKNKYVVQIVIVLNFHQNN